MDTFEYGQLVRILEWEELAKVGVISNDKSMICPRLEVRQLGIFTSGMRRLCGLEVVVTELDSHGDILFDETEFTTWCISPWMCEEIVEDKEAVSKAEALSERFEDWVSNGFTPEQI